MKKGKGYFFWLGGAHARNGRYISGKIRQSRNWPAWAGMAYEYGYYQHMVTV